VRHDADEIDNAGQRSAGLAIGRRVAGGKLVPVYNMPAIWLQ
jgi:hypothetical protein